MEELPDDQRSYQSHYTGSEETIPPAQHTDNWGYYQKSQRFADIMARRPKAIVWTALFVREPTGKPYYTRGCSHRLKPAANPPKDSEQDKRISKTETEVNQSGYQ